MKPTKQRDVKKDDPQMSILKDVVERHLAGLPAQQAADVAYLITYHVFAGCTIDEAEAVACIDKFCNSMKIELRRYHQSQKAVEHATVQ